MNLLSGDHIHTGSTNESEHLLSTNTLHNHYTATIDITISPARSTVAVGYVASLATVTEQEATRLVVGSARVATVEYTSPTALAAATRIEAAVAAVIEPTTSVNSGTSASPSTVSVPAVVLSVSERAALFFL